MTRVLTGLALTLLLTGASHAGEFTTLAGTRTAGRLVAVTPEGVAIEVAPDKRETIPLNQMATATFGNSPAKPESAFDEVELVDGSVLLTTAVTITGKSVGVTPLVAVGSFEVPLSAVASVLRGADQPEARPPFQALVTGRGKRDLFVVRQANGLNPLPGTILEGNAAGDGVVFEREDGRRLELKLNRATGGLIFNPPPRDVVPPTLCRVVDRAGNTLVAQAVRVDGNSVIVTTLAGAEVRYDSADQLHKLDFAQGNVQYLSELTAQVESPPAEADGPLGSLFPVRAAIDRDRAVGGGPIRLAGKDFARGLSIPPDAAVRYTLNQKFREFRTVVGLQDGLPRQSHAMRLRIELDGRAVFDEAVTADRPPRELALDVRDVREVRIAVGRAGALFDGDQLNLADARVQK